MFTLSHAIEAYRTVANADGKSARYRGMGHHGIGSVREIPEGGPGQGSPRKPGGRPCSRWLLIGLFR